jgi:hypothetical protein
VLEAPPPAGRGALGRAMMRALESEVETGARKPSNG